MIKFKIRSTTEKKVVELYRLIFEESCRSDSYQFLTDFIHNFGSLISEVLYDESQIEEEHFYVTTLEGVTVDICSGGSGCLTTWQGNDIPALFGRSYEKEWFYDKDTKIVKPSEEEL